MITKFRAWDSYDEQMVIVLFIDFENKIAYVEQENGDRYDIHFDNLILLQSTGVEDKNGVEIYVGDIISGWVSAHSHSGRDEVLKVVEYQVDRARYNFDAIDVFVDDKEYLEVIGNIYENPELLGVPK